MPRKPRIHFPGAVYHVILRGNAGQPVFFDDRDRYRLYLILQYAVDRFGCRIHGFCLMTNHIHLVMQVGDISLSRIMQNISLRYTKWINFCRSRTGHLFQGRYKAILIDADSYLLELVRYVHLNPVRAGMAGLPEDHPWSGHRAYLGIEYLPWLTTDWLLSMLGDRTDIARKRYLEFVAEAISETTRRGEFHCGTCEGRILGDDKFADIVIVLANQQRRKQCSLSEMIDIVCLHYGISETELKAPGKRRPYNEARGVAAFFVRESPHLSLTELGQILNRDVSALGKAADRVARRVEEDNSFAGMMKKTRIVLDKYPKL
jgi:putative transposase